MNRAELIAAINSLVAQMESDADDLHEVHMKLRESLAQLRATGMPLPEDLVELDRRLDAEVEGVDPNRSGKSNM